MLSIPTSVQVDCEKGAKNVALIHEVEQANGCNLAGPKIQKVIWIKGKRSLEPKEKNTPPPHSASLLLYFTREAAQKAAVLHGVVLKGQLYTARIYDRALQTPQCFKCNRWGHTQMACRAKERCGFCSEEHLSKDCAKQNTPRCPNCQVVGHCAWEKAKCPVFEKYSQKQLSLRFQLNQKAAQWEHEDRRREGLNPPADHRKRDSTHLEPFSFSSLVKWRPGAPTTTERLQQWQRGQGLLPQFQFAKWAPADSTDAT